MFSAINNLLISLNKHFQGVNNNHIDIPSASINTLRSIPRENLIFIKMFYTKNMVSLPLDMFIIWKTRFWKFANFIDKQNELCRYVSDGIQF